MAAMGRITEYHRRGSTTDCLAVAAAGCVDCDQLISTRVEQSKPAWLLRHTVTGKSLTASGHTGVTGEGNVDIVNLNNNAKAHEILATSL